MSKTSEGQHVMMASLIAGEDLSGFQYRVIDVDGTLAVVGVADAYGILQNKPILGQGAEIVMFGEAKAYAGAAIAARARVKVASGGFLVTANSGDSCFGRNSDETVSSGDLSVFFLNFVSPGYTPL